MSSRDDDHLGHVPKITPAHDEIASYQRTKSKGRLVNSLGEVPEVQQAASSGASIATKSLLAVVVVVLLATAALAGYLFQKLSIAEQSIDNYELRISDLERRLDVTDESMSESSVAMKVKVKELDVEIRKLWDNVWKRSKETFAEHEATLNKQDKQLAGIQSFITSTKQEFDKTGKVVTDLTAQLKKAEQMQATVAGNSQLISKQVANLEAAVDRLNRVNTDMSKLEQRVKSTEEWIESINAFRRQMNREISDLKQAIQASGGAVKTTP